MKAAFLESLGQLVIAEAEKPAIQKDDQILIQIKSVGICGSEVHGFEGTHPYRKAPVLLGHEASGVVIETGEHVTKFKPGDRVIIDPQWTCGECKFCLSGEINLCPEKIVLGTPKWPGAFGEFVVSPADAVFALPANLSFNQGALIEPLTVAVHVGNRINLQAGQSVAILGTGSIGGLVSGVCRVLGAETIIAADIRQHCLDAAREYLGATHDLLLPDDDFVAKVLSITDGEGVDVAFITADDVTLMNKAIEITKRKGKIVLIALLTEEPLSFMAYDVIGKEKEIIGSSMCTHADVQQAIEWAAAGNVDVEGILTHVLPLDQAQHGMKLASTKDEDAIKVILNF